MDLDAPPMEIKALKFFLLFLLLLSGCGKTKQKYSDIRIDPDYMPLQELQGPSILTLTEKNEKLWILKTPHLMRYRKKGDTYASPVDIVYFNKSGNSHLIADSGKISIDMDTLVGKGNVKIDTYDHKYLTTEYVAWYKKTNKIWSNADVRMVTEDKSVYTGTGFIANTDLSEWKILKNVHARIANVDNMEVK